MKLILVRIHYDASGFHKLSTKQLFFTVYFLYTFHSHEGRRCTSLHHNIRSYSSNTRRRVTARGRDVIHGCHDHNCIAIRIVSYFTSQRRSNLYYGTACNSYCYVTSMLKFSP